MIQIENYKTFIFDCDGVILDSNKVKTQAFYKAALPYGADAAEKLVDYHTQNGGISRYKKFELFLQTMVPEDADGPDLESLLNSYALEVQAGLMKCEVSPGLRELRNLTPDIKWMVVSGGDQSELREIFKERNLSFFFDGGIFGSPDTKDQILEREASSANIVKPVLFFGDSRYDHLAASNAGFDFIFVYGWTEFVTWKIYCRDNNINCIESIQMVFKSLNVKS